MPFSRTIALTLSITTNGADRRADAQCGQYISGNAVNHAYNLWPEDDEQFLWRGMSVFAAEGSKFNLPAAGEIRKHSDPDSRLKNNGKEHYPQRWSRSWKPHRSRVPGLHRNLPLCPCAIEGASAGVGRNKTPHNRAPCRPTRRQWGAAGGSAGYRHCVSPDNRIRLQGGDWVHASRRGPGSPRGCRCAGGDRWVSGGELTLWFTPIGRMKAASRRAFLRIHSRMKAGDELLNLP